MEFTKVKEEEKATNLFSKNISQVFEAFEATYSHFDKTILPKNEPYGIDKINCRSG